MNVARTFAARTVYRPETGWWGEVFASTELVHPYGRWPRITHAGAAFVAWRMARKLRRLEARGRLG